MVKKHRKQSTITPFDSIARMELFIQDQMVEPKDKPTIDNT